MVEGVVDDAITRDNEVFALIIASDGPSSGLDADTLDGLHGSEFAQLGTSNSFSGRVAATEFVAEQTVGCTPGSPPFCPIPIPTAMSVTHTGFMGTALIAKATGDQGTAGLFTATSENANMLRAVGPGNEEVFSVAIDGTVTATEFIGEISGNLSISNHNCQAGELPGEPFIQFRSRYLGAPSSAAFCALSMVRQGDSGLWSEELVLLQTMCSVDLDEDGWWLSASADLGYWVLCNASCLESP